MHRLSSYEGFLLSSFARAKGERPIWVLSEKKAFYWMYGILRRMRSENNGYNITRQLRFQMERAPESRFIRLPEMSFDMESMLDSFCDVLDDLQRNVLSHYPAEKTVNLMGNEDRECWDDGCERIREILNREPDPARIGEDKSVVEARRLVEAEGFTNIRYYGRDCDVIIFRVGKLKEDNQVVVVDGHVLIPPT